MSTPQAVLDAAGDLIIRGRPADALEVLRPRLDAGEDGVTLITLQAQALKALDRMPEAIAAYRRAVEIAPRNAVCEHNLAAALGDAQYFEDAEAAARRAFGKGLDAPETWLVLARALQGQDRFEDACAAYGEAIGRRPAYGDAHADLAALLWMLSGDVNTALQPMNHVLGINPGDPGLSVRKARILEYAGRPDEAFSVLADAIRRHPEQPILNVPAAQLAAATQPAEALRLIAAASKAAPDDPSVLATLAQVHLALGRPAEAEAAAQAFLAASPNDQYGLALMTTAWRMSGDPRYSLVCDYQGLVGRHRLETPEGWADLDSFLVDLAVALRRLHPFQAHPVGQSVRTGTQTQRDLVLCPDPTVQAFLKSVSKAVDRHVAGLGQGDDPLRRRNTGRWRFNGVWSVWLRPGGRNVSHTHARGWFSSACHIVIPPSVERDRQGWLGFGEPGVPTQPPLAADYYVKPEPGWLNLFPSYMWHGTEPFDGPGERLTIALDVVPD